MNRMVRSSLGPSRWWWNVSPKSSLAFVKQDQIQNSDRVPIGIGEFASGKVLVIFADGHVGIMEDMCRALKSSMVAGGTTGGVTPEEGMHSSNEPVLALDCRF